MKKRGVPHSSLLPEDDVGSRTGQLPFKPSSTYTDDEIRRKVSSRLMTLFLSFQPQSNPHVSEKSFVLIKCLELVATAMKSSLVYSVISNNMISLCLLFTLLQFLTQGCLF